jgi:hypothetical protein
MYHERTKTESFSAKSFQKMLRTNIEHLAPGLGPKEFQNDARFPRIVLSRTHLFTPSTVLELFIHGEVPSRYMSLLGYFFGARILLSLLTTTLIFGGLMLKALFSLAFVFTVTDVFAQSLSETICKVFRQSPFKSRLNVNLDPELIATLSFRRFNKTEIGSFFVVSRELTGRTKAEDDTLKVGQAVVPTGYTQALESHLVYVYPDYYTPGVIKFSVKEAVGSQTDLVAIADYVLEGPGCESLKSISMETLTDHVLRMAQAAPPKGYTFPVMAP